MDEIKAAHKKQLFIPNIFWGVWTLEVAKRELTDNSPSDCFAAERPALGRLSSADSENSALPAPGTQVENHLLHASR